MKEPTIKYLYTSIVPYQDLDDGTPNWHHNDALNIKGEAPLSKFLDNVKRNSAIGTIKLLEYEIIY